MWTDYAAAYACAEDAASGIDPDQVYYAVSQNGGAAWSAWQRMEQGVDVQVSGSVCLYFPVATGTHIRFQVRDLVGHTSESQTLPISQETPEPTVTATTTSTPTVTPTSTPSPTRTPDPSMVPAAWLPLLLR